MNVHEAGAIEYTGHKLLSLPTVDGKLTAAEVRKYLETFMMMTITNLWCFQGWYIFLIRLNMD